MSNINTENYLSKILSVLLQKEIVVIKEIENENVKCEKTQGFYFVSENYSFSIKFDSSILNSKYNDEQSLVINFSERLLSSNKFKELGSPYIVESLEINESEQQVYSLFTKEGTFQYLGKISYIRTQNNKEDSSQEIDFTRILPAKCNLLIGAQICAKEVDFINNSQVNFKKEQIRYFVETDFFNKNMRFYLKQRLKSKFIMLGDEEMKNEDKQMILNINLGKIQISLQDFFNLREGSEISLNLPKDQDVFIQLGTADWAEAKLEQVGKESKITINKLLTVDSLKLAS